MLLMLCCYFNSIKVQLERININSTGKVMLDFNSIKVQLELEGRIESNTTAIISIP